MPAKVRRVDFSPDEWLSGTSELTVEEKGAYITLCALIYSRGGPVDDDEAWLSKACGCHWRQFRRLRHALLERGKIRISEGGRITNRRAELELERALGRVADAHHAAEQSVKARAARRGEQADLDGQEGRTTAAERPQERRTTSARPPHDSRRTAAERPQDLSQSANFNDLGETDASKRGRANHQPSTINHQPRTDSPAGAESLDAARADGIPEERPQAAAAAPEGLSAGMAAEGTIVDEAFRRWSIVADDLKISDVGYLNSTRRAALTQRLAEVGGLDGWDLFLEKVRAARFLREDDDRPKFWVGLGKLLEPETFSKILEDRYAERHARSRDPGEVSLGAALDGLSEELQRDRDGISTAFARRRKVEGWN